MNCRGARQHERLNTIIEEAGPRGYFPFDVLIQVTAVAGGAAVRMMELAEACNRFLPVRARLDALGYEDPDIFAHS